MNSSTQKFVCVSILSAVLQLIVANCLWVESRIKDGADVGIEDYFVMLVFCGVALLCAIDGVHNHKTWQRTIGIALALFPAFLLATLLYFSIITLFQA
jgi:hypothetical protein